MQANYVRAGYNDGMKNPNLCSIATEWFPAVLIVASGCLSVYFYAHFPEYVPTHWNFAGEIDGFSSRAFAAFFFPVFIAFIYIALLLVPFLDPKRDRYVDFVRAYHGFKMLIVVFLVALYLIIGLAGIGYDSDVGVVIPALVGVLFVGMGSYIREVKQNWMIGVRTPWTMSSESVWNMTHRLAGVVFICVGPIIALSGMLKGIIGVTVLLGSIAFVALLPVAYSFILYRREQRAIRLS
jgi:uncharacterized membrane protein